MECPHCHEEIVGMACPDCGVNIPPESRFCMSCGTLITEGGAGEENEPDELDLDERILCPDGTCTGIIVDGKCTECGMSTSEKPDSA